MKDYSVKEVSNICLRCLTKNDADIRHFIDVFKYYESCKDIKKLEALTNIFNQCFNVETKWTYDDSVDESKFVGYNVHSTVFPEIISIVLENQYQKIIKLKFEEQNQNKDLQASIDELQN